MASLQGAGLSLEVAGTGSSAGRTRSDGRPAPGMALAVEQAKLLWATGRQHRAVVEIQEALDDSTLKDADPLTTSRAMLRLARWSAATGQRQKTDVLHIYSNVLRDQRQGLTLVHFSAQPQPFWSHLHVPPCLIDWEKSCLQRIPQSVLTLSRKVDECKPLSSGTRRRPTSTWPSTWTTCSR